MTSKKKEKLQRRSKNFRRNSKRLKSFSPVKKRRRKFKIVSSRIALTKLTRSLPKIRIRRFSMRSNRLTNSECWEICQKERTEGCRRDSECKRGLRKRI